MVDDVDTKLAKLMESSSLPTTVIRQKYTPEELRIREQILAQYSQVELDECEDDDEPNGGGGGGGTTGSSDPIMMKNTNASDVAQLAKERREQVTLFLHYQSLYQLVNSCLSFCRQNWTAKRRRIRIKKTGKLVQVTGNIMQLKNI